MDYSKIVEFPVREYFRQPRSLLGPGAHEMAGPEAATMGLKHVLIVTSGLAGTGILDEVKRNFSDAGVAVSVYDKVESNPKDYNCMDAYQMFTDESCDGFVSLGGGSSHDATKGARVVAAHDGRNVNEFQGLFKSENLDNPPHIAINTTVGTGSETTPFAVINDMSSADAPKKWVAVDRAMTTTLAINDPVLCMTMPPQYVAYTGFDTIAHASEAYAGRVQHLSGTPLGLKALELCSQHLRAAYANPHDFEAMSGMVWAQYIAAQAFSASLLGILHSLSHAVCALYDIHHGLNNGVGIARVWEYNVPAASAKYADIATALGENVTGLSSAAASDKAIEGVVRLARDCGIPENFGSVDPNYPKSRMGKGNYYKDRPTQIQSDDKELEFMAKHMLGDPCTGGNPRDVTQESLTELLRDCIYDSMSRDTLPSLRAGSNGHGGKGSPQSGATKDTETAAAG